jgi:hypothetical protein
MGHPTTFVCDDETADNGHLYVDVDDFATLIIRHEGGQLTCEIYPFGVSTDEPVTLAKVNVAHLRRLLGKPAVMRKHKP